MHNPILQTDTYNRTMTHLKGDNWDAEETYVFSFRRSPQGYLVVWGIHDLLTQIVDTPVTQAHIDEAKAFYTTQAHVPFFNELLWESVLNNGGIPPIIVHAVPDGTCVLPGDPIMRITGPGEIVAHYEGLFHRLFYPTLVATHAHDITRTIGEGRFIEVGMRSTPTEDIHHKATRAMWAGGRIRHTSNDNAVFHLSELHDVGTLGHRYIQAHTNEEQAFRHAIESLESVSLLIDAYDAWAGIDQALALQTAYKDTDKRIWIRLDSGDLPQQVRYILDAYASRGLTDPTKYKIVVESLRHTQEMYEIDAGLSDAEKKQVIYGAGSLLVMDNKTRGHASSAFKLSQHGDTPTMKWSADAGKQSLPGQPTLIEQNQKRVIAQVGEYPYAYDMLRLVYTPDGLVGQAEPWETIQSRAESTYHMVKGHRGMPTVRSPQTQGLIDQLAVDFGVSTSPK